MKRVIAAVGTILLITGSGCTRNAPSGAAPSDAEAVQVDLAEHDGRQLPDDQAIRTGVVAPPPSGASTAINSTGAPAPSPRFPALLAVEMPLVENSGLSADRVSAVFEGNTFGVLVDRLGGEAGKDPLAQDVTATERAYWERAGREVVLLTSCQSNSASTANGRAL